MNILAVTNTHGDEVNPKIPYGMGHIIGNYEAKKLGKRFIESDLNRSFNGKSDTYEEKRAQDILKVIKDYDIVIDVHSTITGDVDACIVVNDSLRLRRVASFLGAKNYIIMPQMKHALISHCNGIALELGGPNETERYERAIQNVIDTKDPKELTVWQCVGEENKPEGYRTNLGNYSKVKKGQIIATKENGAIVADKDFTTFLWGNDQYDHSFGFQLVRGE
jgi:hypothetical protein